MDLMELSEFFFLDSVIVYYRGSRRGNASYYLATFFPTIARNLQKLDRDGVCALAILTILIPVFGLHNELAQCPQYLESAV